MYLLRKYMPDTEDAYLKFRKRGMKLTEGTKPQKSA